jgi:hypothetical protein
VYKYSYGSTDAAGYQETVLVYFKVRESMLLMHGVIFSLVVQFVLVVYFSFFFPSNNAQKSMQCKQKGKFENISYPLPPSLHPLPKYLSCLGNVKQLHRSIPFLTSMAVRFHVDCQIKEYLLTYLHNLCIAMLVKSCILQLKV